MRSFDLSINLIPSSKPISKTPYHMISTELMEIEARLQETLAKGLIRPSVSPWGEPIIFVKNKDGTLHVCIEYHMLIKEIIKNKYPLPPIDVFFDKICCALVFSKIDLKSRYHQLRLKDEDIHKIDFKTRYVHYEFMILSFGLMNTPTAFMDLMNNVFRDCLDRFVLVFLNEILIYSNNEEDHYQHLHLVLQHLREHKLHGNLFQFTFFQKEVQSLEHIISSKGIIVDPPKIKAILEWLVLRNVHEVCNFMELESYYRKFVLIFFKATNPITSL